MILIVGLGNVGKEYEKTRHNAGFVFVDYFNEGKNVGGPVKKFDAEIFKVDFNDQRVILAKPTTYMNNSGKSVSQIAKFYKINPNEIYVIYDDLDLPVGKVKYKLAGSSAGHNGIKSIDSIMGKQYHRIRIGIGRPEFGDISNYVLKKFSKDELEEIETSCWSIERNLKHLLNGDCEGFSSKVNLR